jgi:hypothetical protein
VACFIFSTALYNSACPFVPAVCGGLLLVLALGWHTFVFWLHCLYLFNICFPLFPGTTKPFCVIFSNSVLPVFGQLVEKRLAA